MVCTVVGGCSDQWAIVKQFVTVRCAPLFSRCVFSKDKQSKCVIATGGEGEISGASVTNLDNNNRLEPEAHEEAPEESDNPTDVGQHSANDALQVPDQTCVIIQYLSARKFSFGFPWICRLVRCMARSMCR